MENNVYVLVIADVRDATLVRPLLGQRPGIDGHGDEFAVVQVHVDARVLVPLVIVGRARVYGIQEGLKVLKALAAGLAENPPGSSEGAVGLLRDHEVDRRALGRNVGVIVSGLDGCAQKHQRTGENQPAIDRVTGHQSPFPSSVTAVLFCVQGFMCVCVLSQ